MISSETRAQIRHWFYAEHWKIGTIARNLSTHPDAMRCAIKSEHFNHTKPLFSCLPHPVARPLPVFPLQAGKIIYLRFDLNDCSIPPSAVGRNLTLLASTFSVRKHLPVQQCAGQCAAVSNVGSDVER
jgi:hypothetical protein